MRYSICRGIHFYVGTVLKFKNQFTINFTNRLLCRFIKTRNKKKQVGKNMEDKIKFYGYEKYPLIALNEMRKLNQYMLNHLYKINCPSLISKYIDHI